MRDETVDVADWIRAQYNAAERAATLALKLECGEPAESAWRVEENIRNGLREWIVGGDTPWGFQSAVRSHSQDIADHIAAYDPRFVLADLRSKRGLLAQHRRATDFVRDPYGARRTVPADHCVCQVADGIVEGRWPCTDALWLAQPFAGRPGWRAEWTLLTSEDPEPGHDVTVQDCHGDKWRRTDGNFNGGGGANWQQEKPEDSDPESWTRVAGDYGPVRIVPEPVDPRAPIILWLTSEWPEPPVGAVVETRAGDRWERRWDAQGACWLHRPAPGEPPLGTRSWRVLTDSHGPVRMVSAGN